MPWNGTEVDSEILAVHAALVPSSAQGEVVLFGGDEHWSAQQEPSGDFHKTRVYDVANHQLITDPIPSPDSDVFCAFHVFGGDGRLLIAGGTQKWPESDGHGHRLDFLGHRRCWIYNHAQRSWREVGKLNPNPSQPDEPHSGGRWYPGLYTLGNGNVVAVFGHPDQQDSRHRNILPEVYNTAGGVWTNLPNNMGTFGEPESGGRRFLFFPRGQVMPNGNIFFATPMPAEFTAGSEGTHFSTAFDPGTATYVEPKIAAPGTGAYNGWDRPAVLLPMLPQSDYEMHFMHVGGTSPIVLNLADAAPVWSNTAPRDASISARDRRFANAILLPTGDVCVVGGVHATDPEDAVKEAEIYSPGIDWAAGDYSLADSWSVESASNHARNYHSTALLLPNGKVWVAGGNTNAASGNPDGTEQNAAGDNLPRAIKQIELFEPGYIGTPNRIEVSNTPKVLAYGESFTISLDRAATSVRNVALLRIGSATHSTNNDQRFIGLEIVAINGNSLDLLAPPHGNVAPPGYYMLWVVDNNGDPCEQAAFVRMAHVSCTVITDRSTFSSEEVDALGGGGQAEFTNAVYVQFDGYIHNELTSTPVVDLTWIDDSTAVDDVSLISAGRLQELEPGFADTPQRITFPFHVRFANSNPFDTFADTRQVRVRFTLGEMVCQQTIDLTHSPNPYMIDIDAAENNPAWLSTDVRVFRTMDGLPKFGLVQQRDRPIQFIRDCLDHLNDPGTDGEALFESLSTNEKLDLWTSIPLLNWNIYNYAIARVRYRATTTTAANVKCFFRMFNVAATGLAFNSASSYRNSADGSNSVPLLGKVGGEIVSIPFFASDRVETISGEAGAGSMATQSLASNYEIVSIVPNAAGTEVSVYFGCWLDINRTKKRFPSAPGASDGPFTESASRSIQELVRGEHMCLVAEVFFEPDPIAGGETPGTSDNLSQRNLAILHSDNPGGPDSRTVLHTFEVESSKYPKVNLVHDGIPAADAFVKRYGVDELFFRWYNLPVDSEVTVTFSDIDTAEIQALAALRRSPLAFQIIDKHTLKFIVGGLTWLPIPGGREVRIPALLSIKLPAGISYGDQYRVSLHQVEGRSKAITGSCDFVIDVSKAELIIDDTARRLSVFKHILSTIAPTDRWYPLMQRYVHQIGLTLEDLGGKPDEVYANPDGSGRPLPPPQSDDPTGEEPGKDCDQPCTLTPCCRDYVYCCRGKCGQTDCTAPHCGYGKSPSPTCDDPADTTGTTVFGVRLLVLILIAVVVGGLLGAMLSGIPGAIIGVVLSAVLALMLDLLVKISGR